MSANEIKQRPAPPPARSEQDTKEKFCFPFRRKNGRAQNQKSQTKLFFGGASVSERRRGDFLWSGIFDKVGSSAVVKMLTAMFSLSASAIIFDEQGRVLLCHRRDYNLWNLPGGGVEKKETPWDAVIREAKEETELEMEIQRLVGVYAKPQHNEIAFAFLCKIVGGAAQNTSEADVIQYFDLHSLPPNISPKQAERIRDAAAGNQKTVGKV